MSLLPLSGTGESIPQDWAFTLFEALQKTAEIILRARTSHLGKEEETFTPTLPPQRSHSSSSSSGSIGSSSGSSSSGSSRRFRLNLEVEEVPLVRQRLVAWKDNLHTPLLLDLVFEEPPPPPLAGEESETEGGRRNLLERWYIVFEPLTSAVTSPFGSSGGKMVEGGGFAMQAQVKRAQKRLSVLLRTLYAFLRLTPTYEVVRKLEEVGSIGAGAGGGGAAAAAAAAAGIYPSLHAGLLNTLRGDMDALLSSGGLMGEGRREGGGMFEAYRFADVVTPYGVFRVSVAYRKNASDFERAAEAAAAAASEAAAAAAAVVVQQQGPGVMLQPARIFSDYVVGEEGGREGMCSITGRWHNRRRRVG